MKTRPVLSLLTSSLLLFSGGCGFFQGNDTADQTQPPTPDQAAKSPSPVPLNQVKPLPEVDMAALGLIPPVTPSQRRAEIVAGRTNPFALIPVQATLRQSVCQVDPPLEDGGTPASDAPTGTVTQTKTDIQTVATKAVKPTPSASKPTTTGGSVSTPQAPAIAPPVFEPPPLYPNDARAVVVSGIVQIEQKDFAIVKAPGEPVARHVTVGDRLSGGQVVVKSINTSRVNPAVVLEQYDQSVIRPVGAAALPPLTPPPPITTATNIPGVTGPVDKDGMVTITNPDGTTVRFPAAMAEQQMQNNTALRIRPQRPAVIPLQRLPLRGPEAEGGGYGEIRNLAVLELGVNRRGDNLVNSTGVLCNAGDNTLQVRRLTFQVEDPEDNTILDSIQVFLGRTYSIQKGQKLEFDGAAPVFRGRSPEEVIVKLIDWDSNETQGN